MQHHTNKYFDVLRRTAAALFFLVVSTGAFASPSEKIAPDLAAALAAPSVSGVTWAKETSSGRMVKVLVISQSTADPDLVNLRRAIVNMGGSVYYRYISVSGVSAVLPASVSDSLRRSTPRAGSRLNSFASASLRETSGSDFRSAPSRCMRSKP